MFFPQFIPNTTLDQQILKTTLYNDNKTKPLYHGDLLRCYALEAPKETIGVRVNTTLSFFAINQKVFYCFSFKKKKKKCYFLPNSLI